MDLDRRLKTHDIFLEVVGNAYFQPPESIKLNYPCVVYKRRMPSPIYADDIQYLKREGFECTLIENDPDSDTIEKLQEKFKYFSNDRIFVTDNLYHINFTVYN